MKVGRVPGPTPIGGREGFLRSWSIPSHVEAIVLGLKLFLLIPPSSSHVTL